MQVRLRLSRVGRRPTIALGVLAVALLVGVSGVFAGAAPPGRQAAAVGKAPAPGLASVSAKPTVGHSVRNDTSRSLRDMPRIAPRVPRDHEVNLNPSLYRTSSSRPDAARQTKHFQNHMPSPTLNFDGIGFPGVNCSCAPPDTNGEVGDTQYVQIVNSGFQVFDKTTGASVFGPASIDSVFTGFGGVCETNGEGDPVVLYDQIANRWVLTDFAGAGNPTDECVAVSTTDDAAGAYNRYDFHLGGNFYDYPKLSVWPDGYYMTTNVFNAAGTASLGPEPWALDRTAMLNGDPATIIGFTGSAYYNPGSDAMLPADMDGSTPPPAGAPDPFLMLGTNTTLVAALSSPCGLRHSGELDLHAGNGPRARRVLGSLRRLCPPGGHQLPARHALGPRDVPPRLPSLLRRPRGSRRQHERLLERSGGGSLVRDHQRDLRHCELRPAEHLPARQHVALDGRRGDGPVR